jgi:hypothetical protein
LANGAASETGGYNSKKQKDTEKSKPARLKSQGCGTRAAT